MGILERFFNLSERRCKPRELHPVCKKTYEAALSAVAAAIREDDINEKQFKPFELGDMTLADLEKTLMEEARDIQDYLRSDCEVDELRVMQFASKVEVYIQMITSARDEKTPGGQGGDNGGPWRIGG